MSFRFITKLLQIFCKITKYGKLNSSNKIKKLLREINLVLVRYYILTDCNCQVLLVVSYI